MAELTKVYRGMQNGAETIDSNFNKINDELKTMEYPDDTPWKNLTLVGGWSATVANYRVRKGMLHINILGMKTPALAANSSTTFATLPISARPANTFQGAPIIVYGGMSGSLIVNADGTLVYRVGVNAVTTDNSTYIYTSMPLD